MKFEDVELQALVEEDPCQTQKQLAEVLAVAQSRIADRLKAMRKVYKAGRWVPYELMPRDVDRRKTICEMLLARQQRKRFPNRIVTGDEKWIYFASPKRKKNICDPGHSSTMTSKRNIRGKKAMLCFWWEDVEKWIKEQI